LITLRETTIDDVPALTDLQRRFDVAWFGAPEHDEDEVREGLDIGQKNCVLEDGERLIAAGSRSRTDSSLTIDPGAEPDAALELLIPWLVDGGAIETEVLDRDQKLRTALEAAGWRHVRSIFELIRAVSPDWALPEPTWPDGVEIRPERVEDERRIHELVYVDAAWADVAGHHGREFDEWHKIFMADREKNAPPVLAWRGDRLVGVALGRIFSDGTGWVGQLAVARQEQGRGLGRALLLEAFRRRAAEGAKQLGLGVVVANRGALKLYLDVGLEIEREWMVYAPS
jgi:ribosomal protein S18 acetylase RimI-like enzyme